MAQQNADDALDLGAHSSDFEDTTEIEREAQIIREQRRIIEHDDRKGESLDQRLTVLEAEVAKLKEGQEAYASHMEGERSVPRESLSASQDEVAALRASRDSYASRLALAQQESRRLRENNAALQAEIATLRADSNTSATSAIRNHQSGAAERDTPAQNDTGDSESAIVSLSMQALKGKDSDGNPVLLQMAELGYELRQDLSQLVPTWQAIAKKRWKRKTWDEMTEAILAAPNQCALDKVNNTGSCLWTHDDRQLFACRKSANNGRYCLRPHRNTLLLLPLPADARDSNDPTQPGYYKIKEPGSLSRNKTVWNLWESGSKD